MANLTNKEKKEIIDTILNNDLDCSGLICEECMFSVINGKCSYAYDYSGKAYSEKQIINNLKKLRKNL